jgi:hypothetical protein
MAYKYYETWTTVNKKVIRTTETELEHQARIRRIRAAEYAARKKEEEAHTPRCIPLCPACRKILPCLHKDKNWICPHCGYSPR